jgi:uncharacterized protein
MSMTRLSASVSVLSLVAVMLAVIGLRTTRAEEMLIGTGSSEGVYHQLGRAICRLVNVNVKQVTCRAVPTAGSFFNLSNVRSGAIEIGIAGSDAQFFATTHSGPFKFRDDTYENLRVLFSATSDAFTVVARRDSGITTFNDLKGKRVNIGNPGSAQRATMELVMAAKGWSKSDFVLVEELPASQQSLALCHGRVQAIVYTIGHPNASVSQAIGLCDAILLDVVGPEIDRLIAANPYYTSTMIPGGTYGANPTAVRTFGVTATVVTSEEMPSNLIYAVVKAVFDNLEQLQKMHPTFSGLETKKMVREGLSAPLHEGAVRYFQERGLM